MNYQNVFFLFDFSFSVIYFHKYTFKSATPTTDTHTDASPHRRLPLVQIIANNFWFGFFYGWEWVCVCAWMSSAVCTCFMSYKLKRTVAWLWPIQLRDRTTTKKNRANTDQKNMFFEIKINEINSHDPGCVGCVALFVLKHSTLVSIPFALEHSVHFFFFSMEFEFSHFFIGLVLHGCWFNAGTHTLADTVGARSLHLDFGRWLKCRITTTIDLHLGVRWCSLVKLLFYRRLTCSNKRMRLNDERTRIISPSQSHKTHRFVL